ncbi:CRISPR system precrRNA processing endoribonuclease RAMP protein Cas6 [Nocardia sp. CA-119907]|uniref:CRISPR system precrRNA processing endoribonuclease RAMP protein Cas6 n=1 Tax=Nocardia sp. CA-119907 TaxID=3239973 RepID=UPI003D96B458
MPALIEVLLDIPPGLDIYPARLHGAACALFEQPDTHHTAQTKPFTASPLLTTAHGARWKLGWLHETPPPPIPTTIRFGDITYPVLDHTLTHRTYAQLATTAAPIKTAEFHITSPMYFSRNGRDYPLPDPVLIITKLADRWNHHAPPHTQLTDTNTRNLNQHIYLAGLDGHTVQARATYTSQQTGFLGTFTLALPNTAPTDTYHTLTALTHYAEITGIGAQTTRGYGTCHITNTTIHTNNPPSPRKTRPTHQRKRPHPHKTQQPQPAHPGTSQPDTTR